MSRDRSFTKGNEYREITDSDLYYDLGYKIPERHETQGEYTNSVMIYLLLISLILFFVFDVYQLLTIISILIYSAAVQYFAKLIKTRERIIGITIILFTNIVDHLLVSLVVLPGSILSTRLSIFAWGFEILWILTFGVEFLSIFAPKQDKITLNRTVKPADELSKRPYESLYKRVKDTPFSITDFKEEVDTSLLQKSFRDLIKYLIGIFIAIVIFDILIWEIISIFSGGNNIQEAYFVSGISFIIYLSIIIYSANLFPSEEKSDEKTS